MADERPVPEGFTVAKEGKARILQQSNETFYNPAQVVNRDLTLANIRRFIATAKQEESEGQTGNRKRNKHSPTANLAAIKESQEKYGDKVRILEGLAASGLRAIRFGKELEDVVVYANDMDPKVVESMKRNIEFNGVEGNVIPHCMDARLLMLQNAGVFDAVDLDPYGTPAMLLDSAVQSLSEGGLLMVTATDMAVLCGNNPDSCWSKYGSFPLHRAYCHEQALRILLACIESHAARHKRYIVPMISLSIDFYVRVFVRVYTSAAKVKESGLKQSYLYQSQGCDSFFLQPVAEKISKKKGGADKFMPAHGPSVPPKCPETGSGFLMGGPIWSAPIHDPEWVKGLLDDIKANKELYPAFDQIHSILVMVAEELIDVPLYVSTHNICKTLKCTPPRHEAFRSALVNAGYRVSSTHANALGIKTDAPMSVIWDIMRCWIRDHPIKAHPTDSYAGILLAKEISMEADFSKASAAMSQAKVQNIPRFLPNPEENWGPKTRHGKPIKASGEEPETKKAKVKDSAADE